MQALLFSYGGYLNLVANAGALAARWLLPLAIAPYLTIGLGLLFQLLPPLLLLTARDEWLRPLHGEIGGGAADFVRPGVRGGLVPDPPLPIPTHVVRWPYPCAWKRPAAGSGALRLGLLVLAPLCGPGSIILFPLFLIRGGDRSGPALRGDCRRLPWQSARLCNWLSSMSGSRTGIRIPSGIDAGDPDNSASGGSISGRRDRPNHRAIPPGTAIEAGHVPWVGVLLPVIVFGAAAAASVGRGPQRAIILAADCRCLDSMLSAILGCSAEP